MAIRKIDRAAAKAANAAKDKVQASEKAPAKTPVRGQGMDPDSARKLAALLIRAAGFEGDDAKAALEEPLSLYGNTKDGVRPVTSTPIEDCVAAFVHAESREPRELEELLCWVESPKTALGTAYKRGESRWTAYLKAHPVDDHPAANGKVRDTARTCVHAPLPESVRQKRKTLARNGGLEAFQTAKDRTEKGDDGLGGETRRMATKKPLKAGRQGLTIKDAQTLLKTAKGTPAKGYSADVTKLCKAKFGGRTVSTLKVAELNALVGYCREAKLVK